MIFDKIQHIQNYSILYGPDIQSFLNRQDLHQLKDPEVEIRGRELFVRIMRYRPKVASENKFETHRIYADVQVVITGREIMQVAPNVSLVPSIPYNQDNDYQFYNSPARDVTDLIVTQQTFVVFYPGEPHRPSCLVSAQDGEVFKLVFKVRMDK
ncbi:MAG: YhcH/YjgK/YiaL family protein [Candidatus Omnitrophica bacterium]|nr:YhcH/YjgK/YiaL family protein [Candidatus Omnitrophota bacterium]